MASIQKSENKCWGAVEKLKPLCAVGGVYPGTVGKTVRRFLKMLKTELLCDPAIPFLGVYLKELKAGSGRYYLHIHVHSSIIPKSRDGSNPNVHRWMNGSTWYIHTIEYYSALR